MSADHNATVSRRDVLRGLGATAAAAASSRWTPAQEPPGSSSGSSRQPNILWITGEGVPLSTLSCYGSLLIHTPNIDRIANEGMRFENAFCTNALCAPGRATLLTGTYSHVNGMLGNPENNDVWANSKARFDTSLQTFPQLLKQHGYQTGMVGKWHLEPATPAQAGFDYFVFKRGAGGPYYDPTGYLGNPKLGSAEIQPFRYEGYETDVITDLAIRGMQQFRQPFLMMVQFFNAHRPFDPPHKYEHLYDSVRIPEPGTFWDDYEHRASPARAARMRIADMPDFNPPTDLSVRQRKQWNYQKLMEHFLGTLRSQDDNIGRIFAFLEKNGLLDNTIIVYTTDHGFFLGDHGWFDKRFMYEQALRVPWMIRFPGKVKPGTVRSDWTVCIDNAPTALDLVGLPVPQQMQGRSLVPLLSGAPAQDWRSSMYYHYYEFGPPHWAAPHYGIRTERYKLIHYYTVNQWELFDLEKDPDEMDSQFGNLGAAPSPAYADVAHQLLDQLRQIRDEYRDTTGAPVKLWPPGD
jgi:arylsulfatase A-like enzyme